MVVGYVEPHGGPRPKGCSRPRRLPDALATAARRSTSSTSTRPSRAARVDAGRRARPHERAGLRHAKRWQDVEELLEAGIDVLTTVNVQHVESLNDVVAQVSGVTVRETVPDEVFSRADEVALVDLPPEDLLERLREGKVYVPAQAERALRSFFSGEPRRAAGAGAAADRGPRPRRRADGAPWTAATAPWAISERLLVCVGRLRVRRR